MNVDNHSHIILADVSDMIAAARRNSLEEYSIPEHVSLFKGLRDQVRFSSIHSKGRLFESIDEYNDQFRNLDIEARNMKVNEGLEVDFSLRFEHKVGEFVNRQDWDILLCSVHEFDNATDVEKETKENSGQSAFSRWRDYLRLEH